MIYTVTMNPALDYNIYMPHIEPDAVNRSVHDEILCGGKGINVSLILHRLGQISTATGFVAGFTGKYLTEGVRSLGIKTDFVTLPGGMTRINVKLKAQHETDINAQGPEIDEASRNELFGRLDMLRNGDYLVLSGSVPPSLPDSIYAEITEQASGKGVNCIVDATGELLVRTLRYEPFLIKPNNFELSDIIGRPLRGVEELADGARQMQKMGARNVLVSLAGDGALLLDEQGRLHRRAAPEGHVINSVGAGDSMVAGYLAGYLAKKDYDYALALGTAAGSATAFSAGLAEREEIIKLFTAFQDVQ